MISVRNLCLRYPTETALDHLSFDISPSEKIAIVGGSGSGKTTLLYLIAGLLKPDSGHISLSVPATEVAIMFQDDRLLPWKTVTDNLLLGLQKTPGNLDRAARILHAYGLSSHALKFPSALSGGQKQRIALARVMFRNPSILLLDEPTASLDEITKELFGQQIKQTAIDSGLTMLLVTHNVDEAVMMAERIIVMKHRSFHSEVLNPHWLTHSRHDPQFALVAKAVRDQLRAAGAYE